MIRRIPNSLEEDEVVVESLFFRKSFMLYWNNWLYLVIGSFIVLLISIYASFALAHDHSRPELNGWYQSLQSRKGPCCDGSEAKSLEEPQWRVRQGHYEVYLEDEWVEVPETALVNVPNRDGRTLVWPFHSDGHPVVRCFMPGSMT